MTTPSGPQPEVALTAFQIEVSRLFFGLPASEGFLLAGGAALAAQQLTTRPTQDLDMFAGPGHGGVSNARDAFEAAASARGWTVHRIRDFASFLSVAGVGSRGTARGPRAGRAAKSATDGQRGRPDIRADGIGRAQAPRFVRSR